MDNVNYSKLSEGKIGVDNVNHPKHYEGKYECIEEMISDLGADYVRHFCLGNTYKYLWRCAKKNGYEDIRKANWYIHKYLELNTNDVHTPIKKYILDDTPIDLLVDIYGNNVIVHCLIVKAMCEMKNKHYKVVNGILETIISIIDQEES